MEDGTVYLEKLLSDLQIDSQYIEQEKQKQVQEIQRRKGLYRKGNEDYKILNDKIVILVDDGGQQLAPP
jgi:predicted phosphoribosyltransferase